MWKRYHSPLIYQPVYFISNFFVAGALSWWNRFPRKPSSFLQRKTFSHLNTALHSPETQKKATERGSLLDMHL